MIISDILMPGMDGFSLCRAWKADERLKAIPFVFYTATYVDSRDEKLALDLGAERFLIKPMDPDEFIAIIKEIIVAFEKGKLAEPSGKLKKEEGFYKEYNEALIRKLEDKMLDLQHSNKRLSSLYLASCNMLSVKSAAELIHVILKAIVETAGYQQANYFAYAENRELMYLVDLEGYSKDSLQGLKDKLQFKVGEPKGIVGKVAQSGHSVNLADTSKDPDWISLDPSIKSALFTPVIFEKKLIGVIGLFSKKLNAFSAEDENDIAVLGNSLAVAVENIKNMEKSQKQLGRISALHNIDMAINSSLDLHNMLNIFLKHVTSQLKVDAVDVLLCHHNESICEFAAGRGFRLENASRNPFMTEKNLGEKVKVERRIVHLTDISHEKVSPDFLKTWHDEKFVTYFGVPLVANGEVVGILEVFHRSELDPDQEWLNFLETLAGQAAIAIDKGSIFEGLQRSNFELSMAYDATIQGWSRALDMRDHETEGHTQRVTEMTIRLAGIMGLGGEDIIQIRRGALLHDIGKLGVPDAILLKPGELNPEEQVIMNTHPQLAYTMLQPISYLQRAIDIPYCHHEKWDGSGYPRGLKGEQIPLVARIFCIVDVYDSLLSDRPYRKAWSQSDVENFIREQSGKHFEPRIVDKFLKMIS
jgi:response regulator RpfG family c-di-GMP phosphodiesterase/putative methionine-R-sulfoxide reductase with GAF domain